MASWRSYLGGRYSPFGANPPPRSPPTVTEDDYHYLGPEDIVDPPRSRPTYSNDGYFPSVSRHVSRSDAENPNAPDILVLRHRGTTYPLHFPAFAIGEGLLRVGELRKLAAKETGTSNPRRIKLLYKGRTLKDDAVACREEGLKQNSELLCVISETADNGRSVDDSSESANEDEMVRAERDGPRVDVDGTLIGGKSKRKGHRGGKKTKRGDNIDGSGYPGMDNYPGSGAGSSRSNTPQQQPSNQTSNHNQGTNQQRPKSPMDKLDELAALFHTKFEPLCIQFKKHPPPDAKTRDFEYKKLSESILAQIILKLDEVDTSGNEDARGRRRALVRETQDMLNSLDALVKK